MAQLLHRIVSYFTCISNQVGNHCIDICIRPGESSVHDGEGGVVKISVSKRELLLLLTDTFISALVISWTALVPLAVVCLHSLSISCFVGDSEK